MLYLGSSEKLHFACLLRVYQSDVRDELTIRLDRVDKDANIGKRAPRGKTMIETENTLEGDHVKG
jgi:hypothetical protein